MPHHANLVLQDEIWAALQAIPKHERTALVNQALGHWLQLRRREAAQGLDELRAGLQPAEGNAEQWIRQQRDER